MKAGSVTVDLAAANGGNIGPTRKDEVVVTDNGWVLSMIILRCTFGFENGGRYVKVAR